MRLRLITANIGRKASVQHTRADFETIRRLKGITGFQEIDEADKPLEHSLLKAVLSSDYFLEGLKSFVPVAIPKGYEVINARVVYGAPGVAHYSPNRYFVVVVIAKKETWLDKKLARQRKAFVVINTHYPAGAYHGDRPAAARRELIDSWDRQFLKHKSIVKHYVDKGYTVFWTGDVNRTVMPKVHPREVQVVTVGIDSVSYVPGGVKVKVIRKGSAQLYSDHNAQYADFELS